MSITDGAPDSLPQPARPGPLAVVLLFLTVAVLAGFSAWILQPGGHPAPPPPDRSIPWPAGVQVDPETFRMTTLPTVFGPYRLAQDGELREEKDGQPDGEIIYDESVLHSLDVGTPQDKLRHASRRGNWYVSRRYLDTRTFKPGQEAVPFSLWHLDVIYYTGEFTLRPHTPETVLAAGPRQVTEAGNVQFALKVPPGPITFNRVVSEHPASHQRSVDYYGFIINGRPETSRAAVRKVVSDPRRRSYFAKIQFAPRSAQSITDLPAADRAAGEFLQAFLPEVLKCLPTPEDLDRH